MDTTSDQDKKTKRFGPPTLLDLAFAMDCTGSMGSYIEAAKSSIQLIVDTILATEECDDVKLALVEYRDHPPQDRSFVTRVHDFTSSVYEMKEWLEKASASGGGDLPEAVADAMHDVAQLSWRMRATKICVLISDAPPHGLISSGDSFKSGCPKGHDPVVLSGELAELGVILYVVGCEPALVPYKDFFLAMAGKSGGQYVPLQEAKQLASVIIGGVEVELCMQQLLERINWEVLKELKNRQLHDGKNGHDRTVANENVIDVMHQRLEDRGVETFQLLMNNEAMVVTSKQAESMAKCSTLEEIRSNFTQGNYENACHYSTSSSFSTKRAQISRQQTERLVRMAAYRNRVEW